MTTQLIDRIYEASFVPELWPSVLDDLADLSNSVGGSLLTFQAKSMNWTSSDSLSEVIQEYINKGWLNQCDRRICMARDAHSQFLTENDYWTEEQFKNNYVYNELFRPFGIGFSAGTGLLAPTGDAMAFFVERSCDQGPMEKNNVQQLNELRPHLARSAFVASRLGLKAAKTASDALSKLGVSTVLLKSSGAVVDSQNITDFVAQNIAIGIRGHLTLKDKTANELLEQGLETLRQHSSASVTSVKSIPVRDEDGRAAMVGHLIPICGSAMDIFSKSYAVCILIPVTTKNVPNVDVVRSLFDFTASEAQIARYVARGTSVSNIASERGVTVETVRTQLKSVMEKTGCKRQAELAALLVNITI